MAVSIAQRPQGFIFSSSIVSTSGITSDNGVATVNQTTHGLITGDFVYIYSDVEDYNGFWYVEVITANSFKFRRYSAGTNQAYVRTSTIVSYYECSTHNWNCIHLPIIYKLSSTIWPTNSADTVRTISSVTDSNSYCALALSGDIKATGAAIALEYVKITGATDDDLNGVWQIISYTNETTFTVEIPYSSANDTALTGASVQYYYNNYHVKVQVWGGLNNGHVYYGQEPYQLLATLSLIPDSNGICQFSIHEILKKNIAIKNNLLLATLPNNLDAWTGFFIKYCEVYDDSDGTTLSTLAESYTSDLTNFEGYAVNAELPFKNVYSGALSEYASQNSSQKLLGGFPRPTIFSGQYFDIHYIFQATDSESYPIIKQSYYLNDVLQQTTFTSEDPSGTGVYRSQITDPDCDYNEIRVTVLASDEGGNEIITNPGFDVGGVLSPWVSVAGVDIDWTQQGGPSPSTARAQVAFTGGTESSDILRQDFTEQPAGYYILLLRTLMSALGSLPLTVNVYNDGVLVQEIVSQNFTNEAAEDHEFLINITGVFDRIEVVVRRVGGAGANNFALSTCSLKPLAEVTETKTIDINCECLKSKATGYNLSWLNYLSGFDYWYFTEYADHAIEITDSGETEENTFPDWPNSYGEFADTIRKQTYRKSRRMITVRSQNLSLAQLQAIEYIKTSNLVQIVNSIYDRRTVIVDTDSFTSYKEGQKEQYTISFIITYTDDVPSQTV